MPAFPRRVAIVGLGPTSVSYIREVDKAGDRRKLFDETWTFNSFVSIIACDRLFHMDDVLVQQRRAEAGNKRVGAMLEAMKRFEGPIYTSTPEPEWPTMVGFPLLDIANKYDSLYFTTTPPYAAAFAGLNEVEEVSVYGCDYTWPGVAGAEQGRACMEYWLGRLKSQGVNIRVADGSTLLDNRFNSRDDIKLYGYDRSRISIEEHDGRLALCTRSKELPSAEEIEERYSHYRPGSGIQLDVVN